MMLFLGYCTILEIGRHLAALLSSLCSQIPLWAPLPSANFTSWQRERERVCKRLNVALTAHRFLLPRLLLLRTKLIVALIGCSNSLNRHLIVLEDWYWHHSRGRCPHSLLLTFYAWTEGDPAIIWASCRGNAGSYIYLLVWSQWQILLSVAFPKPWPLFTFNTDLPHVAANNCVAFKELFPSKQ